VARRTVLALEDGRQFFGYGFGAEVAAEGEVVFCTSMTGYQEICTDPSYRGQLVCLTYPIIGSYGVTPQDDESRQPWLAGLIVREYCPDFSNWRAEESLEGYLSRAKVPGIYGVDTRALTRHLRTHGLRRGVIRAVESTRDEAPVELAKKALLPSDKNVVGEVTTPERYEFNGIGLSDEIRRDLNLVVLDCGLKENILRSLARRGLEATVVPFDTPLEDILALKPSGVLSSPGPGDPENVDATVQTVRGLLERRIPFFGICMGHQLLGLAVGATTSRLKFGHRGANHPVKDSATGRVHITSQNHGFQVDRDSIPEGSGWYVNQVNLNDGSVEGLAHP
jgi:carbamoyl-phosphate synthase small subunit